MSEQIEIQEQDETILVPHLEEGIPLPKNAREALPEMSPNEEVKMRANTIKLIADMNGDTIEPTVKDVEEAEKLAIQMLENPDMQPEFGKYSNETMAYLAGMVSQTQTMLTKQMADYKLYVLNSAVMVSETAKSHRDKLAALRMIGEMDGVDAFKKKTEITHVTKSGKELEDELKKAIEDLKGKIVEGEVIEDDDNQ
jgi:hypothetical protein